MHQVLCSTGALIGRPNGRDFRLLATCVDRLKCDGFEFMMYDTWYEKTDELCRFLKELSISIPVMHCEKHIGEAISRRGPGDWEEAMKRFLINCQMAAFLGADRLVIHLWDGLTSDRHFENNLAAYGLLAEQAGKHGLMLLVENVVCTHRDPLTHWRALNEEYPDVSFILDTKMAAFHGQMTEICAEENEWLWKNKRIRHLHVNDYAGGYLDWQNLKTLHIGRGKIDFKRFFDFLKQGNYAGDYTVEATSFIPDGIIRWQDLNESFARLRDFMK